MSANVAARKLRGLRSTYQLLPDLTDRLSIRTETRRMAEPSHFLESKTSQEYHPFGGDFNSFLKDRSGALPTLKYLQISRTQVYAAALVALLVVTVAALLGTGVPFEAPLWAIAVLVAMAILAEKQSVAIGPNTQMSVAALPILFAAVVYDPYAAMIVGGGSVLVDLGRPYTRWTIWTASRALTGAAAGIAALAILEQQNTFSRVLAAVIAAGVVEGLCDVLLNSMTVFARRSGSVRTTSWTLGRLLLFSLPFYAPMVAALAYAFVEISPWTVVFFAVPALAAQRLLGLYQNQRVLTESVIAANERLEGASLSFAAGLVAALDARDHYTAGHSAIVAVYSRDIARHMGLTKEQQELAHLAGLLHDIGKVGLPPGILEKAGPLTADERREMELHAVIGQTILKNVDNFADVAHIVRHHHERLDGSGYPDRLSGEDIPLISRIIAVADAFGAMTSARSYRKALPTWVARDRLREDAGTQFDSRVVRAFEAVLAESDAVTGHVADGTSVASRGGPLQSQFGFAAMPQ
jgi:putative nucleotidyltransferase with HDIG domain